MSCYCNSIWIWSSSILVLHRFSMLCRFFSKYDLFHSACPSPSLSRPVLPATTMNVVTGILSSSPQILPHFPARWDLYGSSFTFDYVYGSIGFPTPQSFDDCVVPLAILKEEVFDLFESNSMVYSKVEGMENQQGLLGLLFK
ncbi:hypothetical protein L6452_06070 [Arctium lappa]|uniref:Uncharacterized protein n=1 Tax=Arctium lappa TaxID=4217 RepID=A0ACB9EI76_ARCLA|nr:hypothetical protein L6452_06070 [Arctium lappa]